MSRAARVTAGALVTGVLGFVAVVAGLMSGAAAWDGGFEAMSDGLFEDGVDTPATAEVLDVDDIGDGWPTVDVRWTTGAGEVVVTYVDWEWSDDLPEVGEEVDVMYDAADPEWAFAAADPFVDDLAADAAAEEAAAQDGSAEVGATAVGSTGEVAASSGGGVAEVAGWVALSALLGMVVTAVVTVVAAARAPAPVRDWAGQHWGVGQGGAGGGQGPGWVPPGPYVGDPFATAGSAPSQQAATGPQPQPPAGPRLQPPA